MVPPTPVSKRKGGRKVTRKLFSGNSVEDQLWAAGFVLIFTDGSSEKHPTLGDIAGYGVYSHLFSQGQEVLVKAG